MRVRGAALRAAWRPLFATAVIGAGLVARAAAPGAQYHRTIWYAGLVIAGGLVVWRTVRGALRGHFAADVVATLAIIASAVLGQPFVGLVIVIMQTGGEALERYAEGRASDAVRALEAWMQVGDERFDGDDIQRLYQSDDYPLQRRLSD